MRLRREWVETLGPSLAAQIPGGNPANSMGQSPPCQSPTGQILVLFGSPLTRGLQPIFLHFPRGNNPRPRRPGGFPLALTSRTRLSSSTRDGLSSSARDAARSRGRRHHSIRPSPRHLSAAATSLRLAVVGLSRACDVDAGVALRRSSTAAN